VPPSAGRIETRDLPSGSDLSVIVVQLRKRAGVDLHGRSARARHAIEQAGAVEEEMGAIARPVRCLDVIARAIDDPPLAEREIHHFQRALNHCGVHGHPPSSTSGRTLTPNAVARKHVLKPQTYLTTCRIARFGLLRPFPEPAVADL
jgi:hypothetical protein